MLGGVGGKERGRVTTSGVGGGKGRSDSAPPCCLLPHRVTEGWASELYYFLSSRENLKARSGGGGEKKKKKREGGKRQGEDGAYDMNQDDLIFEVSSGTIGMLGLSENTMSPIVPIACERANEGDWWW